jgi:hypothetical protein
MRGFIIRLAAATCLLTVSVGAAEAAVCVTTEDHGLSHTSLALDPSDERGHTRRAVSGRSLAGEDSMSPGPQTESSIKRGFRIRGPSTMSGVGRSVSGPNRFKVNGADAALSTPCWRFTRSRRWRLARWQRTRLRRLWP